MYYRNTFKLSLKTELMLLHNSEQLEHMDFLSIFKAATSTALKHLIKLFHSLIEFGSLFEVFFFQYPQVIQRFHDFE